MKLTVYRSAAAALVLCAGTGFSLPSMAQITFQDIYDNPDDQELNLAYARQQVEAGRLSDAASALERMLFYAPDWDSTRLLYATVLYDLDDRDAAQREFEILAGRDLPPDQQSLVEDYLEALETNSDLVRSDATGFAGRLILSARYDDNAGGVFEDVVFGNRDQSDESVGVAATVRYAVAVDGDTNTLAYLGASAQLRRHDDVSEADFDVYGLRGGLTGFGTRTSWNAELSFQDISIGGNDYLKQTGLTGRYGYEVWDGVTLSAHGGWYDRNYNDIAGTTSSDRTGDLAEVGLGLAFEPNASLRLRGRAFYQSATADVETFAYDGPRLTADARYIVTPAIFLAGSVMYRELNYDGTSIFVAQGGAREDTQISARGAVGVRASALFGSGGLADGVAMEVGINHSERDTNIPGGDFDNLGGDVRLILDF